MRFSSLILAGGRSSRMGCDKALLEVDGTTLLKRQLALVASAGASERIVSLATGTTLDLKLEEGIRIAYDHEPDLGPLSGLAAGLCLATAPHCLVLAVDLPEASGELIEAMQSATRIAVGAGAGNGIEGGSHAGCRIAPGIVPRLDGQLEPLLAIYPSQAAATLARQRLGQRELSATHFARAALELGLVRLWEVPDAFRRGFINWNRPGDWYPQSPGRSAQRYY